MLHNGYCRDQVSLGHWELNLKHSFASRPSIATLTQYSHTNWVLGGCGCFTSGVSAPLGASSTCSCTEWVNPVAPRVRPISWGISCLSASCWEGDQMTSKPTLRSHWSVESSRFKSQHKLIQLHYFQWRYIHVYKMQIQLPSKNWDHITFWFCLFNGYCC